MHRQVRCRTIFMICTILMLLSLLPSFSRIEFQIDCASSSGISRKPFLEDTPFSGRPKNAAHSNLNLVPIEREYGAEMMIGVEGKDKEKCEKIRALVAGSRGRIVDMIFSEGSYRTLVAAVPNEEVASLKWKLLNDGLAKYVEPNAKIRLASVPNDPEWYKQWALPEIKADLAWDVTTGSPAVAIAIVDTGVDWNHPDLTANIWNNTDEQMDGIDNDNNGFIDDVRGWDFVDTAEPIWPGEDGQGEDNDPMDFYGHGTHCAGIAAAVGNNNVGVTGATWNCTIMPVRAGFQGADGNGYLELDDAAAAITYAADNGAEIISMSWGSYDDSPTIHGAIEHAHNLGVLLVAAAGNDNCDDKSYPAAYEEVIAVAATDQSDNPAWFTNFGEWTELTAPGVDIYSTVFDDAYSYESGTSMAAPLVAGVAGLVWSRYPSMNRNQIRAQLRVTSDDFGDAGFDIHFGYGRVNAEQAVELELQTHDVMISEISTRSVIPLGKTTDINITVLNMGKSDESSMAVQLLINNSLLRSENVAFLASGEQMSFSFPWNTSQYTESHYILMGYVTTVTGENYVINNYMSRMVFLRQPRIYRIPWDFSSIQSAVDAASEGDTITVSSGTYSGASIYKDSVRLIGAGSGSTILDGGPADVILVWADNVEIRGFTVKGSRRGLTREPPFSGLMIYNSRNVKVSDVVAINNLGGIFLYCSSNATLEENSMIRNSFNFCIEGYTPSHFTHHIGESNTAADKPIYYLLNEDDRIVSRSAGCLVLVNCTGIRVEGLNLVDSYAGIFCVSSENISIASLQISSGYIGLYVRDCRSLIVNGLNAAENTAGVQVEYSENVTVQHCNFTSRYSLGSGMKLIHSKNVRAVSNTLTDNTRGMFLSYCDSCTVSRNSFTANTVNVWLDQSTKTVVTKNQILNAWSSGVFLTNSYDNTITENNLANNTYSYKGDGIALNLESSFNNAIYHNNFINNTYDVSMIGSINQFDDGYPDGGNYWEGYTGADVCRGLSQNETGSDGIGDVTYTINEENLDRYPLMGLFGPMTRRGANVTVFVDASIAVTFENVTAEGLTTANRTQNVAEAPAGLKLVSQNCEIGTTAYHRGRISFRIIYDESDITQEEEEGLQLLQLNETLQQWRNITTCVDVENHVIYGETNCLSPLTLAAPLIHDVAVTKVAPMKAVVCEGFTINITIGALNQGDFPETLNITAYANASVISSQFITLASGDSLTLSFVWNTKGSDKGRYFMTAVVQRVFGEENTENNACVSVAVAVVIVGDVNADNKVDLADVHTVSRAYGSFPTRPNWDPVCDINNDAKVDLKDYYKTCKNYGKTDP